MTSHNQNENLLKPSYSGKVRDIYEVDKDKLVFVTSDRISAFDVVMDKVVPDKGRTLTALTLFWLQELKDIVPNHLISSKISDLPTQFMDQSGLDRDYLAGRTMLVKKAEMLPIECIVRGYVSGSAWKEYSEFGTIHNMAVSPGLAESDKLPEPIFTPSTKAAEGHDENIDFDAAVELVGSKVAKQVRDVSLQAYKEASKLAATKGILLADTKFEFGLIDGELILCDEVLTSDSSRFWAAEQWQPGSTPPSFDKQPLRDWLEETGWDKQPPPPQLPDEVVLSTRNRYIKAFELITGTSFSGFINAQKETY